MKKLYTQTEYNERKQRTTRKRVRSQKKLKLRLDRFRKLENLENQEIINSVDSQLRTRIEYDKKNKLTKVHAPENFSMINNPEEMITFYSSVKRYARIRRKIHLIMNEIKRITPDAILYMLALMEYNRLVYHTSDISGDFPEDPNMRQLFSESGFLKFVQTYSIKHSENKNIISVASGQRVDPVLAKKVVEFSIEKLNLEKSDTEHLFQTLIECMANTNNHAYKSTPVPKWFFMAHYNVKREEVQFSFLDGGLGIPTTIKKKFLEKIRSIIPFNITDWKLIFSALKGEFRTQTGKSNRGKGLPDIKNYADEGFLKEFKVVSCRGFIDYEPDSKRDISDNFRGTLLSWIITKSNKKEFFSD